MNLTFSHRLFYSSLFGLIIAYAVLYFFGDVYVSEFVRLVTKQYRLDVIKSFNDLCSFEVFEILACGITVIYLLFREKTFSRKILFVAITLVMAMLFAENLKWLFGRARPEAYFKSHIYGMQWFKMTDIYNSTPSGHSTRAMALGTSLFLLCKNKWLQVLLLVFAVGQALCRVVLLRHYLSDVLFGMWLGFFIALYIFSVMFERDSLSGNK